MSITEEKEEIVKRIYDEEDLSVIHAIKDFLDSGHIAQNIHDEELEKELKMAISEADNNKGIPHEEVWAEIKNRYKL